MKKRKLFSRILLLLAIVFIATSKETISRAGNSSIVVDKSSYAKEISATEWSNPNGDVVSKDGVLIFGKDSVAETRLISVVDARTTKGNIPMLEADVEMNLSNIPKNEKFIFAMGLQSIESYQGEAGNVEIAFSNNGGLKVEVTAYDDGASPKVLVKPMSCGITTRSKIKLHVVLTSDGKMTCSVGTKKICTDLQLPVSGEGSVGFLQTGSCEVSILDVKIHVNKYETPKNCNIDENFDNGALNKNVLTSRTNMNGPYYPHSLSVKEYNGNQVLMFERCHTAYLSTLYSYSNFEITFDVPYFEREGERDEDGKVLNPATRGIMIAFGADAADTTGYGYTTAADYVLFNPNSQVARKGGTVVGKDETHLYGDAEVGKPFSVKVSVVDSHVTVGVKWMTESKFTTVMQYQLEQGTPTGYVQIWCVDVGNFAVDNLKITNLDVDAQLVEVEYKSGKIEKPADYEYKKESMVFREVEEPDDFNWYIIDLYAGIVAIVILAAGVMIRIMKHRKRDKEGK